MRLTRVIRFALAVSATVLLSAGAQAAKAPVQNSGGILPMKEDRAQLVAVYLSIKLPQATFVLASNRRMGKDLQDELVKQAQEAGIEIVLPVVSDILQEAMTAVRIAVHDTSGLRNIADMQGAKTVIAGRFKQVATGAWSISWSLSNTLGWRRWQSEAPGFGQGVQQGLAVAKMVLSGELNVEPHPLPKLLPMLSDDRELREESRWAEEVPDDLPQ